MVSINFKLLLSPLVSFDFLLISFVHNIFYIFNFEYKIFKYYEDNPEVTMTLPCLFLIVFLHKL